MAEMDKNKGAATRFHDVTASPPKLADLGINRKQSSRWQLEASVPEEAGRLLETEMVPAVDIPGKVRTRSEHHEHRHHHGRHTTEERSADQ